MARKSKKKEGVGKSSRFLVFSDLHANVHKRYAKVDEDGRHSRLQVAVTVLDRLFELGAEKGIRDFIFAGDLFESKGRVPIVVLNAIFGEIAAHQEAIETFVMVPGNHDFAVRSGSIHALQVFEEINGVRVVTHPSHFTVELNGGGRVRFTAIPYRDAMDANWFEDPGSKEEVDARICIAHGMIKGSAFAEQETVDGSCLTDLGKIDPDWLKRFDLSVVGHVHLPQRLGEDGRILVPGQPWHQFPFETSQRRGVWEVTMRGCQPELLMHELDTPRFKEVVCCGVPRDGVGIDLRLAAESKITMMPSSYFKVKGDIVLLRPENRGVTESEMVIAKESLERSGASFVEVLPFCGPKDDEKKGETRVRVDSVMEPADVLKEVLHSGLIDLGGNEIEGLYKLGHEILDSVKETE